MIRLKLESHINSSNGITDCITSFFNHIVREGRVPNEWHLSYTISHFKGKGDALSCENYRGFKLQDQAMDVLGTIIHYNMQLGVIPGTGVIDMTTFILWQLQEKYLHNKKNIYFAFVDLEKTFYCVPYFFGGQCRNCK